MERIPAILDCEGETFGEEWRELFEAAANHEASGLTPFAAPRRLLAAAANVFEQWRPWIAEILPWTLRVMAGSLHPHSLSGFCLYGFLNAYFWHCFDVDRSVVSSASIANCLHKLPGCFIDDPDWGPLEFSESSRWPLSTFDIRLLHEHWAACGDRVAANCPDTNAQELRARLRLQGDATADVGVAGVLSAGVAHQLTMPAPQVQVFFKREANMLPLVVIGSHLGSNMEPLSMVAACAQLVSIRVDVTVYGTVYPWPEMICELFGYCERNAYIDTVVNTLVKQMYNPSWEPSQLLPPLEDALRSDAALRRAELLVCAQPMPVCSLMRALVELPMLVYQAFPLLGATPVVHRPMLLSHFREMARAPRRSAFVVYSEFLSWQFVRQVGRRPLCLRPHSLYATQGITYDPDRENPRIAVSRVAGWARDGAAALVNFVESFAERDLRPETNLRFVFLGMSRDPTKTVSGLTQPFGYVELRRFRAAVYFPWDMGMLLFSELYAIGVPLLLPDRAWMSSLIKRSVEITDFGWWQARFAPGTTMPCGFQCQEDAGTNSTATMWPWLDAETTIKHVLQLYDGTDFARWPYVTTFASIPGLMKQAGRLEFDSVSQAMRQWNDASLPHSLAILSQTMASLLAGGDSPPVGASSCI